MYIYIIDIHIQVIVEWTIFNFATSCCLDLTASLPPVPHFQSYSHFPPVSLSSIRRKACSLLAELALGPACLCSVICAMLYE